MELYKIKNRDIKLHNVLYAITSEQDYEMSRILLLEGMENTKYNEFVLAEGYHCSCYDFDDTEWDCTKLTLDELVKILEHENKGSLRYKLKNFLEYYKY